MAWSTTKVSCLVFHVLACSCLIIVLLPSFTTVHTSECQAGELVARMPNSRAQSQQQLCLVVMHP